MDKQRSGSRIEILCGALATVVVLGMTGCGWLGSSEKGSGGVVSGEASGTVGTDYQLGAEDVLMISVWRDEQLTKEVVVRPDGMVSFPLVGDLQAAGRTVDELRAELAKKLTKFIPNPQVSVAVTKVLSNRIYVLGRVNKPGEYMVGHQTDVLQALSLAGGVTPFAAENDIRIMRRVGGEQRVFPIQYGELKKGRSLEQNILLQRGDVVMVP
jgi:polysaccharide export outer membrane protein